MDSETKEELLTKRKEALLDLIKKRKTWIFFVLLIIILYIGSNIRIQNLSLLKDQTTNDYIPADLDALLFNRYAEIIAKDGSLPDIDYKRSYPVGLDIKYIDTGVSYFSAYLYKIANFFNPKVTIGFTHSVLYPLITFILGSIFFFLLVRLIFNNLTAILATAFLSVMPAYLTRTVAGFSDKEPLGMLLIFVALYFYVKSIKSECFKNTIIFGLLSGLTTGLLSLSWGGVIFVITAIPFTYLITILIKEYNKKDLVSYASWFLFVFIFLGLLTTKYGGIKTFFTSYLYATPFAILIYSLILSLINKNKKYSELLSKKVPLSLAVLIICLILGSLFMSITLGSEKFKGEALGFISKLSTKMTNRWAVTVAENKQPYFTDWKGSYTSNYIVLFMLGSMLLFYNLFKHIRPLKYKFTIIFIIFILSFTLSSYSESSILNGQNNISYLFYYGGVILFILASLYFYLTLYKKDKENFKELNNLREDYILMLILFLIMIVAARTSVRFLFTLVPSITIMASFFISEISNQLLKFEKIINKNLRIGIVATIILIVLFIPIVQGTFIFFTKNGYGMARGVGPIYSVQWQHAGKWIRENTPENAVFAHWWDYGYMVQDGADRATLTDGGNIIIYWNHLLGRHALLAQNETEALEFLYAHNATHLLIVDEEVGKFPAYSSIGSDENYDRYSILGTFAMDQSQSKETRDGQLFVFRGQSMIDQDFIINDKLIPENQAAIIAVLVEVLNTDVNGTKTISFKQPTAIVYYQGKQIEVPVNCIYLQNKLEKFPKTKDSFDGCLRFLPILQQTSNGLNVNDLGAFIYLSPKVSRTLFSQLYLLDNQQDWKHFKKVYDPSITPNNYSIWSPYGIYSGRFIGPIRIWEIQYPKDIKFKPEYLEKDYPNQDLQIARR